MPPPSRFDRDSPRRLSLGGSLVVAGTLLVLTWGTFAFGAVYPWAYVPLAAGCATVGAIGLATGTRPVMAGRVWVLMPVMGIALVTLLQLVPLSERWLSMVSPGTTSFLRRYDLAFAFALDPTTNTQIVPHHAISVAPALTIRGLALLVALGLFLLGLLRTLSRTSSRRLGRGIVTIGCVLAIVGVGQKALLGDHAFGGMRIYGFWQPEFLLTTPFGPFVNKNHFAGWMLMAIPMALGLAAAQFERARHHLHGGGIRDLLVWLSNQNGGPALLSLVAALLMTLSLFMTGSRSGIGCFVASGIGMLFAGRRLGSSRSMLGVAAALGVVLVLVLQWAGPDAALQRFVEDPESVGLRLSIWRTSLEAFRQFPVLGSGLNTFGTTMILFQPDGRLLHYQEAHNDYVQLLVEGGLVTLTLALVGVGMAIVSIRGRLRAEDDSIDTRWVRLAAATGLAAIALQSTVEFSLQMPGNAALCTVLLAVALHRPAPARESPRGRPGGPPAVR